jgi:transposase family protein
MSNDLRRGRHVVYNLHVHLVFVAKYRGQVFTQQILDDMQAIFENVCSKFEAKLVEFNGESDHVHLLIIYPPKVAISSLVNSLKGVSSRLLRKKEYPTIKKQFLWDNTLWSPSYFAGSCGGDSMGIIRQYIEQQNTPN